MSLIILEGPDGAGKTTLAQRLAVDGTSSEPTKLFHHGAYPGESKISNRYLVSLYAGLIRPRRRIVMDRSWIAEPIYGDAVRDGANRITPWERRILARVAMGVGAVIVLCLPPIDVCVDAWRARIGTEYLKKRTALEAVHAGYERWFRSPDRYDGPPVVLYDWTDTKAEPIEARVARALVDAANTGPGIGSWAHATTLLIGDRANRRPGGRDRLPFCSTLKSGCSAWLTEQLEAWNVPERTLYWVNQLGLDANELFGEGAPVEKFDRVVALGSYAAGWCARNTVPCHQVDHPQYWKRFHSAAEYPLKDVLV